MKNAEILIGEDLDEGILTIDELAQVCAVTREWIVARVESGVLHCASYQATVSETTLWRFNGDEMERARKLASIERHFDTNEEAAALIVDMMDEIQRLKHKLAQLGVTT